MPSGQRWLAGASPELLEQLDQAAAVDLRLRQIANDRDEIRRKVNDLSKQVGQLRRDGRLEDAEAAQAESRALGGREGDLANAADAAEAELRDLLLRIPNLPHPDAPDGAGEDDNPVVKGPRADAGAVAIINASRTGRSAARSASWTRSGP